MPSPASGNKPKALFLSPEAPYPAIGGGPLRAASILEYLAKRFSVHAILFRQPGDPDPTPAMPPGRVAKLDVIQLPYHSKHPLPRVLRNVVRYARNTPPLMDRFSGFSSAIAQLLHGNTYDIAILEHFWIAPYLEQVRPHCKRVVLDLVDIESVWHERVARSEGGARAFALRRFAKAALNMERKLFPAFDHLLVTSAHDAETTRSISPHKSIVVYPNSLPEMPQPPRQELEAIVFSGNLEYPPNISAVRFFATEVWPSLHKRWPHLTWKLLGKNPQAIAEIVRGIDGIEITGPVDDAVAALAAAQTAVVPVLAGSGTRVKILEAWAAGTPVISTRLGAEGLDSIDGEHLLIANDAASFVEAVSRLLASPTERQRIGRAGRHLYEEHYIWPAAWRALDPLFTE